MIHKRKKLTLEIILEAKRLRESGLTMHAIASHFESLAKQRGHASLPEYYKFWAQQNNYTSLQEY